MNFQHKINIYKYVIITDCSLNNIPALSIKNNIPKPSAYAGTIICRDWCKIYRYSRKKGISLFPLSLYRVN